MVVYRLVQNNAANKSAAGALADQISARRAAIASLPADEQASRQEELQHGTALLAEL